MYRFVLAGAGILTVMLASCVVGGGYDGDVGVAYSPGYIAPYGYEYGGWGEGYLVGPGRGGDRRGAGGPHAYRSAPQSHPTPSIPHGSSGGASRGGHR